ncbi:hypothetical protein [Microaerobacter geothermalis]|nr:hypothetical protein [Microaerobacter geothermalis]
MNDEKISLQEVADLIYQVAQHAVTYEGKYIAGSEEDKYRHKK